MTSKIVLALSLLFCLAGPALGQAAEYGQFAAAIIEHFPPANGQPTEVSPLARCATFAPEFRCEGVAQDLSEFAEVYAMVRCNSERNFEMLQLFWFERGSDGAWVFVKTQTVGIT